MTLKAKGIIIDLDGTLVDSREAYREALKKALAAVGLKNFNIKIAIEIPRRLEQGLPIGDLIPKCDVERFLGVYLKTYYSLTESKTKPLPDVSKTLEELSIKAKLAVVTMRYVPREKVRKELENFGMAKYFHSILTALDTPSPKPSPEALIKSAQQLGVKIEECISVGDSVVDVRAGKNSGAKAVAVLSGIFTREELEKENPDLILQSINELPCFIN
ncbi:MAG: HAD family hydrolase [Nitrososphaerota archaeon]|nr:HAD family hydrolase [Candidatus Bathyarchaeota archaeon]MDW8023164.1 HAD family hydrolase [Nitrososphaerota archaeon]